MSAAWCVSSPSHQASPARPDGFIGMPVMLWNQAEQRATAWSPNVLHMGQVRAPSDRLRDGPRRHRQYMQPPRESTQGSPGSQVVSK